MSETLIRRCFAAVSADEIYDGCFGGNFGDDTDLGKSSIQGTSPAGLA